MSNGEQRRIVKYKRIVNPADSSSYVDVPCITDIWFLSNDGQMYHRTFDSTANNTLRQTHISTVQNQTQDLSGNVTADGGNKIDVERIDQIQVQNSDWYEYLNLSNSDGNPSQVRKTHVLRYNQSNTNDANATPWVDIEVIDEFTIQGFLKQTHTFKLGETDASQINIYSLTNDPGSSLNNDDGSDPRNPPSNGGANGQQTALWGDNTYWGDDLDWLPLDTNGNPDPVRLDPFQNIVNVSWGGDWVLDTGFGVTCEFIIIFPSNFTLGSNVSVPFSIAITEFNPSADAPVDINKERPYIQNGKTIGGGSFSESLRNGVIAVSWSEAVTFSSRSEADKFKPFGGVSPQFTWSIASIGSSDSAVIRFTAGGNVALTDPTGKVVVSHEGEQESGSILWNTAISAVATFDVSTGAVTLDVTKT
jgi:hypothetical protein